MSCRIGMTTDVVSRKKYWQSQHSTLHSWKILEEHSTKTAAQNAERRLAASHGCESHGGGKGKENDSWYVYKFCY